jgi:predicted DCC family thiol-disulfide oxidoreductase YuxK
MPLTRWWHRLVLEERPSAQLSLFRIAVAVTVGCHVIPSLLHLDDNYLATAFTEKNFSFFPLWALRLVEASPDWLVVAAAGVFLFAWACFLVGFKSQWSALAMTAGCYYFYALNSLHIGTLSYDILLVTLSLIWITGYHGDWLSVDGLVRGDPAGYAPRRPFFVQRLLRWQIAWTYFYTALSKISAGGNWLTDNPYYYLMNYPPMGVVSAFPGRAWLAQQPDACKVIGIGVLACELSMPLLLSWRRSRAAAIALGFFFHVLLVVTLHVPTIFFFLFPAQLLLWLEPEQVVGWVEALRARTARAGQATLLYDGQCRLCRRGMRLLGAMDVLGYVRPVDCHGVADPSALHPALTPARCRGRMQLIEPGGRLTEGFASIRRLSLRVPWLWLVAPLCWLPGIGWLGGAAYDWVAARRMLWHRGPQCRDNQCAAAGGTGSSNT